MISAGNRRAIQRSIDHHGGIARRGSAQPDLAETGEFLTFRETGIHSKPARAQPIERVFSQGAEVAGPLEDDQLIENVGAVKRGVQPKTGNARHLGIGRDRTGQTVIIILKIRRGKPHGFDRVAFDFIDLYGFFEEPAGMESMQPKGNALFLPTRLLGAEADPLVGVVIKLCQKTFDGLRGRVGRLRQFPHLVDKIIESEGRRRYFLCVTAQGHQRRGKGRS